MRLRHFLVALALCLAVAPLAFAQQFSSLEERMSSQQFKDAGLDKLTPEQLAKLNEFIRNEVNARTAQTRKSDQDRFGFHESNDRDSLVTRIEGTFTGWDGHTVFHLNNGQVWEQIDSSETLEGIKVDNPIVKIEPGFMGSWVLSIDGYNGTAKVKRIK